jgi:hypothetical protein
MLRPPTILAIADLVLVGAESEVLDSLSAVLGSTEDQGVAASGSTESQLVEGDGLTTGSKNAGTGSGGEPKGGNGRLGERQETVVIGDGADNDDGALLALLVDVGNNAGQRDRGAVDLGHEQSSEDHLVESGIGSACHPLR